MALDDAADQMRLTFLLTNGRARLAAMQSCTWKRLSLLEISLVLPSGAGQIRGIRHLQCNGKSE
jgi:hypothetical protein